MRTSGMRRYVIIDPTQYLGLVVLNAFLSTVFDAIPIPPY